MPIRMMHGEHKTTPNNYRSTVRRHAGEFTNESHQSLILGSLTQRYVKRHGPIRKGAEISRFWRISSPSFALRFQGEIVG